MSDDKIELLMLEQFRIIRGDIAKLADDVRGLKVEMIAVRHHVRGMELQQDGDHDDIAAKCGSTASSVGWNWRTRKAEDRDD